jgi:predicted ABC-type transport system involved in lysophospholipase L1 biosynthesis ATPase subunit
VPLEALLRTVEDSSAAVESRLGAAVAATSGGDPDAVQRVRVAAAATASPRLRVALEAVAVLDSSEPEAEAALRKALEREALP